MDDRGNGHGAGGVGSVPGDAEGPVSETYAEQVRRVQSMASGSETWDLSDNDIAALTAVLEQLDALSMEVALLQARETDSLKLANELIEPELRKDKARLEYLFNLRSPYFSRGASISLIETDCGAMRITGTGNDERSAIDAAMEASK